MSSTKTMKKNNGVSERRDQRQRRIRRTRPRSRDCGARGSSDNGGVTCSSSKVSEKLEALKSLIPSREEGGESVKPEQLFEQTADYIVRLRTQVAILQKLIEFYGSSESENGVVS